MIAAFWLATLGAVICVACGDRNPSGSRFCTSCGAELADTCPVCHVSVQSDQNFCGTCGHDLRAARIHESGANSPATRTPPHLARRILADRQAIIGERKRITVMFADVVGSTAATEGTDPEEAAAFLNTAVGAMMDAVHRYEGTVNELLGDGMVALFGAPIAHEDHAVRACLAGMEIERAVTEASDGRARTRVGLHSGEVFVQAIGTDLSLEYQALGPTVHLAARMEQIALPGSVYVTAATRNLTEGFVETRPVGPTDVKGVTELVEVFELVRARSTSAWDARAARGLTRFVARDSQLAVLTDALSRARESEGQVVAIVGEAGVGKSRLLHEFLVGVAADLRVERGSASPYDEDTTYFAIKPIVRSVLGGRGFDLSSFDGIESAVRDLDADLIDQTPALAAVLDVDVSRGEWVDLAPEARRRRIRQAIRDLILSLSATEPLVIAIEDLHWIDGGSQSVVDDLVDVAGGLPLLVLVTHRIEYGHDWGTKSNFTRLGLTSLAGEQADAMVDALIGSDPSLAEIRPRLLDRSEGTPLFLEECVRALVDSGGLTGSPGNYRASGPVTDIDIPDSVQAVLAARIDRLDPDEKFVVQAASVIGETVDGSHLEALAGGVDLASIVTELQNREFLYVHRPPPSAEYRFKHALTRDVAYDSLPRARRRELHADLVRVTRVETAGSEGPVERLAYHAIRGELWDEAVEYSVAAGEKSINRSGYGEASRFLRSAVDALENLPPSIEATRRAIDIHMRQRVADTGAGGDMAGIIDVLRTARDLAASIDDKSRMLNVDIHLGYAANMRGDIADAEAAGHRALDLAQQLGDRYLSAEARLVLGQTFDYAGRPLEVLEMLEGDIEYLATELRHERMGQTMIRSVVAYSHITMANAFMGRFAHAADAAREALLISGEASRPFDQLYAHYANGVFLDMAGQLDLAVASHQIAADIGDAHELWFIRIFVQPWRGHALLASGRVEEAAELLDEARLGADRGGLPMVEAQASVFAADAHRRLGDLAKAEALATASLADARARGLALVEIPALRTLARIGQSEAGSAELLDRAEKVAEARGLRPWLDEIRAQRGP